MISEDLRKLLLYVKGRVFSGNGLIIDSLIDKIIETGNVNIVSGTGYNLLHFYAMQTGKEDALLVSRKLLENGINVNAKSESGRTPLMQASTFNNVEMVKLLLEFGADINLKDNSLHSAIDYASNAEIFELLIDTKMNTVISKELMRVLLESVDLHSDNRLSRSINNIINSGNINYQDNLGNTLLHYFIYPDRLDIIKLFLDNGSDPMIKNNNGYSVYDYAKNHSYFNVIELLDNYFNNNENERFLDEEFIRTLSV